MNDRIDEQKLGRNILWRLVLPAALFILMGAIDRVNVGFGALQMNADLGFSATQFGFGATALFTGYLLFKLPSVMVFEGLGMRRWLALITLLWGVAATAMAFIHSHTAYYLLRFAAGVAEAGLSSGLMLYLSHWAIGRYRARILAVPIVAISVSQVISAPLSGWLLQSSNPFGWEGWRWMFLVEGLPSLVLVVVAWLNFPDSPRDARWLQPDEATWLEQNVKGAVKPPRGTPGRWAVLRDPVMWICAALWFCLLAGNYGVMFWLPLIVHSMSGLNSFEVGIIVALPWLGAAIGLLTNAWHSDKTGERFLHVAVPAAVAGVSLCGAFLLGPGIAGLFLLVLGGACMGSTVSPFWAVPTRLIAPEGLAVGMVTINMVGAFAGLTIPPIMGMLKDKTGSYGPPTFVIAGAMLAAALLCLAARRMARTRNEAADLAG